MKQGLLLHRLIARRVPVVVSDLQVSIAATIVNSATVPVQSGMRVDAPFDCAPCARVAAATFNIPIAHD
jgi:hypothetical protein